MCGFSQNLRNHDNPLSFFRHLPFLVESDCLVSVVESLQDLPVPILLVLCEFEGVAVLCDFAVVECYHSAELLDQRHVVGFQDHRHVFELITR